MSCDLPGERLARFGANAIYAYKKLSGSFVCNTTTFGADPLPGVHKHCDYSSDPNEPTPTHTTTQTPNYTATPTSTLAPTPTYTATPTTPVTCATKPVKPVLASPKDGALIRKGQALLKWQAAPCADTYIVVIQDQQTHQRIEKQAGLVTLQYHTEKLEPASAYRWKVIAVNAYGRSSSKWREMRTK